MQRVFSADDLFSGNIDLSIPMYLDTTSWREFQSWSKQNHQKIKNLVQKGLVFWIFESELESTQPTLYEKYLRDKNTTDEDNAALDTFETQLQTNLGIYINTANLPTDTNSVNLSGDKNPYKDAYTAFLYEIKEIYFHDVTNEEKCDRHCEFIFLVRRAARNENKFRVISAQPAFQRLVNAEIFLIPSISNTAYKPMLPANFDVFTELQIHPRLRQVVEVDFRNGDWPKVVFQAVNAFRDFVWEIVGHKTFDGGELMNQVLNPEYKSVNKKPPAATKLSPLRITNYSQGAADSDANEQDGFYRFTQGIFKAIRNPNAHLTHTDPFIQSRFHDENTAIKVLCFLSMICERIDKPRRHHPS